MIELDRAAASGIVRRRLGAQGLADRQFDTVTGAVSWHLAVQAQEYAEVKWSLSQRVIDDPGDDAIEAAFTRGEVIRTHVLRPTWHAVAAEDLRWLLELSGPRVQARNRPYYATEGLDETLLARCADVLRTGLADGGPRTRAELGALLGEAGIVATGNRLAHVTMYAELDAVVCSGPRRGTWHTYQLVDDRVPPSAPRPRDEALAELACRFFRSHGPATARDLSWWSGLTMADVRRGIELAGDAVVREEPGGTTWWSSADVPQAPATGGDGVLLLGMYDELVVAYRDLKVVLPEERPPPALLERAVVHDGMTIGSWKRTLTARSAQVEVTPFVAFDADQDEALRAEVDRFGRFLGLPAELALTHPTAP